MLNITVSHSPQSSIHFLNYVEVDVSGVVHTFQVTTRSETTFTISADLGSMNETQTATVRAHCNIDGYSTTLYGPITVPESQATLLTMALMLSLLIGAFAAQLRTLRHLN